MVGGDEKSLHLPKYLSRVSPKTCLSRAPWCTLYRGCPGNKGVAHGVQLVPLTHMGCQPGMASQAQPDWGSMQPAAGLGQTATCSLQPADSRQPAASSLKAACSLPTVHLIFAVCFSCSFVESWTLVYWGVIPPTLAPERVEALLLAGKASRASPCLDCHG